MNPAIKTVTAPVQAWWQSLAERERRLLAVGGAVLLLGVVWALLVQPAWRTLKSAPSELDRLEAQLQNMQQLAAETQQLRAAPPITPDQASAALNAATTRLGDKGKLLIQGTRATLTLTGVGSTALRDWLTEARAGARAKPIEANLTRATQGYSGTLVLAIGGPTP
jgi:general secretion pathway protein M